MVSIYTPWCNQSPDLSHLRETETLSPLNRHPPLATPPAPGDHRPASGSYEFDGHRYVRQWDPREWVFVSLVAFTQRPALTVHPFFSTGSLFNTSLGVCFISLGWVWSTRLFLETFIFHKHFVCFYDMLKTCFVYSHPFKQHGLPLSSTFPFNYAFSTKIKPLVKSN